MKTNIKRIIEKLRVAVVSYKVPAVSEKKITNKDPFKILVATIISLRTKDAVTVKASKNLFAKAPNAFELTKLNVSEIEKLIYPAGFFRTKARVLNGLALAIVSKYNGRVPSSLEELLKLKGVGRKTANLVITEAFGKPGICVDTHVHRIMNRFGYVKTKTPEQTEFALRGKLPGKYWVEINKLLVTWGQNICLPVSPLCSHCLLNGLCAKVGVVKSR